MAETLPLFDALVVVKESWREIPVPPATMYELADRGLIALHETDKTMEDGRPVVYVLLTERGLGHIAEANYVR